MKRFLFVVPPLVGHVNPTVSIARELAALGHGVAWAAHPRRVRPLLPEGSEIVALDDGASDDAWAPLLERGRNMRGLESFQFLWEEVLVPLARAMRPQVERAIEAYAPDVVVVDHQAIGGALAARRAQVRWASLCTTSASVIDALPDLPKIMAWSVELVRSLEREAELEPAMSPELSPALVLVLSTPALVGKVERFPSHFRFVGPSIQDRPDATPFDWARLREGRRVLVSLGTVSANREDGFYATVARALGVRPSDGETAREPALQVILVAPKGALPEAPDNFIVCERVPQLALMKHVQAVVTHGGHNTVCEALAHGVPLVVTPIRDDQPIVANQVVAAGAGLRLRYGRLAPSALAAAVQRVLEEPAFRDAAARVGASFTEAGGAKQAARLLVELA